MNIIDQALKILESYPIINEMPISLSGLYHKGETHRKHIEMTARIMKNLCRDFNISKEDTELLIAASYLHDIGVCSIVKKGKIDVDGWKYYEITNYSRLEELMELHPLLSARILDDFQIDKKEELKKLVSVHMSKWYINCPQPNNLYEYLMCISDYIATFQSDLWEKELK